ncbi:MAG: hypothetical protein RIC55_04775 [Pirellulaceae bacterium]
MPRLDARDEERLIRLSRALIDQQRARVIVPANQAAAGFWFGGGNLMDSGDGRLWLVGRYRNAGDSRTGLGAGERGLELAVFCSRDRGGSFEKVVSLAKQDLNVEGRTVLSIEGTALHACDGGVELFVSSEKSGIGYPAPFEDYLKPGTGVWTIDRLAAPTVEALADARPETVLSCDDPRFVHVKDPFVCDLPSGDLALLFCTHPYCWTSSNTGYALRRRASDALAPPVFDFFPRGVTWDVAMTRGTCVLEVPRVGPFAERPVSLLFYDGGECVRNLDEHQAAVSRPRGYSCEELGGLAYFSGDHFTGDHFTGIERLSRHAPMFVSPHGTGCSRYVDVLAAHDGLYATWQQSQADGSQPLVISHLSPTEVESLLG